jgi:16S rRNA (guanine527-N7)-methyltransferase
MSLLRERFPNVDVSAWSALEAWAVLLRDWNSKINLISRRDIDHLEEYHLSHCLAITNHLKLMQGTRVLDVGTGGGFPGIIMAICYPQAHFTLIDSIGKKVTVVKDLADQLGLKNVEVGQHRAEEVKKQFDFVTGRAVKNLPEFFSWIRENLRRGSRNSIPNGVLYWKGGELEDELELLGIRPRKTISLEQTFSDSYFREKYILHFDARDVPRVRKPRKV